MSVLKEIDNFLKKDQNKDLELAAEDLRMATRHLEVLSVRLMLRKFLGLYLKTFV